MRTFIFFLSFDINIIWLTFSGVLPFFYEYKTKFSLLPLAVWLYEPLIVVGYEIDLIWFDFYSKEYEYFTLRADDTSACFVASELTNHINW